MPPVPAQPAGPLGRGLAWLGGAVFVGSLGYFAYAYVVRFGRTTLPPAATAADLLVPALINTAWFSAFALHHSVMARAGAKHWVKRYVPPSLERTLYVWVGSALFLLTCGLWREVPGEAWTIRWPWSLLARGGQLFGVWLTLRSARVIDIWDLSGIRQARGRPTAASFQVAGPYGWLRHPIYLGWVCLTFAAPHMTATRLTFACISAAYLALAVPFEERSLVRTFRDEYRAYQRRVRWRMLPGLY